MLTTPPLPPATSISPMNVVLAVCRQIIVDDERNLLDVDATCQQVRRDENPTGAGAELTHDHVTLALLHVAVLHTAHTNSQSNSQSINQSINQYK